MKTMGKAMNETAFFHKLVNGRPLKHSLNQDRELYIFQMNNRKKMIRQQYIRVFGMNHF